MLKRTAVKITEANSHFEEFLSRVYRGDEYFVIEKDDIPVAALIGIHEYERFRRWLATQTLHALGPKLQAVARRQGLTEEQLLALMEDERNRAQSSNT